MKKKSIPLRVIIIIGRLLPVFFFPALIGLNAQYSKPPADKSVKQPAQKILFNQIPTELGLSQNVVTCSLQDKTGFLWFGTKDGLNRFDGYQFKVYRHNPQDAASLSDSSITALFEDHKGRMWVGTENGLNFFDRTRETFHRILPDPNNPNSLSHQQIRSIAEDKQGAIWISTPNGLNKMAVGENENPLAGLQFTLFKHNPYDPDSLNEDYTGKVFVADDGIVWVLMGTSGRVNTLALDAENKNYIIKPFHFEGDEKKDSFKKFCKGQNGKIWLAGNTGIVELNTAAHQTKYCAQ